MPSIVFLWKAFAEVKSCLYGQTQKVQRAQYCVLKETIVDESLFECSEKPVSEYIFKNQNRLFLI